MKRAKIFATTPTFNHLLAPQPDVQFFGSILLSGGDSTIKVSIASSRRGLFSAGCFLLKEQSLFELRTETDFCMQISIELKIKIAKHVVNRFA